MSSAAPAGEQASPLRLSINEQVKHVRKLLEHRGEKAAEDIRRRIARGDGVVAKGVLFTPDVLQIALDAWKRDQRGPSLVAAAMSSSPTGQEAAAAKATSGPTTSPQAAPAQATPMPRVGFAAAAAAAASKFAVAFGSPARSRSRSPRQQQFQQPPVQETASRNGPVACSPLRKRLSAPAALSREDLGSQMEVEPQSLHVPRAKTVSRRRTLSSLKADADAEAGADAAAASTSPDESRRHHDSERNGARVGVGVAEGDALESPGCTANAPLNVSVKNLKARLAANDLDYSGCVEKSDLEALWRRFEEFRARCPEELRTAYVAAGGCSSDSRDSATAEQCARFLAARSRGGAATPSSGDGRSASRTSVGSGPVSSASFGACFAAGRQAPAPESQAKPAPPQRRASTFFPSSGCATPEPSEPAASSSSSSAPPRATGPDEASRTATEEVRRILGLRKEAFPSHVVWAFMVLATGTTGSGASGAEIAAVQKQYRALMKKLHPDKVGHLPGVEQAVEAVREAKELCERRLSRQEPPGPPRNLHFQVLCDQPGRRRVRLKWSAPPPREIAPVRRYMVAAFDPSYGRALTVTVLEPDYSEELRRYVSVEELSSYVLAEEELKKMPSLFKQATADLQVAAANEAGQSAWATLRVPLNAVCTPPAVIPSATGPADAAMRADAAARARRAAEGLSEKASSQSSPGPNRRNGISCGLQAGRGPSRGGRAAPKKR